MPWIMTIATTAFRPPDAAVLRPPETGAPRSSSLNLEAKRALGALLPLIDRPELRDVLIQVREGVGTLWLDEGRSMRRVPDWSCTPDALRGLAVSLIAAGGRHIDELHPCADVKIGDGIRVHAVLAPACTTGAAVSIRMPRPRPLGFDELTAAGLCSARVAETLRDAVRRRCNVLITGGTGTGKTTVLGALLDLSAPEERIITIEDVAELRLRHEHWVALEARQANSEGVGSLSLDRLLREALRMRPDRIVLGECRGGEITTLLTALNTGHDGGAGTLHSSGLRDVPARLEALGALGGLDPAALARQVRSALHLVVHLHRSPGGRHSVAALGQFVLQRDRLEIRELR